GNNYRLSGPIPEIKATRLEQLLIYNTNVSGSIPASLKNLTKLVALDLSNNSLTGSVSLDLFNSTSLQSVNLRSNLLSGFSDDASEIPSTITM
ncbi:hypothetical protein HDU76_012207, partial [Blyttiomyces sp. JEL0837]